MTLAIGSVAAVIVFFSICVAVRVRRCRTEHTILKAVADMSALLQADPAPQRILLGDLADILAAQDGALHRLERKIRGLMSPLSEADAARAEVTEIIADVLDLPEPTRLVTDFIIEHAGSVRFGAAQAAYRTRVVEQAVRRMSTAAEDLGTLVELAAAGEVAPVATAMFETRCTDAPPSVPASSPEAARVLAGERSRFQAEIGAAPYLSTLDPTAVGRTARSLNEAVRRQLRLVTMLHAQAEKIIGRTPPRPSGPWTARVLAVLPICRRLPDGKLDLAGLTVAFDAAGEVLTLIDERLAEHEPLQAVHLLATVRLPLPAGFPGRILTQEALTQVRPLAELGVLHRLAIARWAGDALAAFHRRQCSVAQRLVAREPSPPADARRERRPAS
jgi:hypothetical protein